MDTDKEILKEINDLPNSPKICKGNDYGTTMLRRGDKVLLFAWTKDGMVKLSLPVWGARDLARNLQLFSNEIETLPICRRKRGKK